MSEAHKGHYVSAEARRKIGDAQRAIPHEQRKGQGGKKGMPGHPVSEEHKARLRIIHTGKIVTAETRAKIGAAHKGKPLTPEHIAAVKANLPRGPAHWRWKGGYSNTLALNEKRYLLERNAAGSHTREQWEALKQRCRSRCVACNRPEPHIILTEDHIVPLSRGGSNDIENIQPLCQSCNSKKRTQIINYLHAA
jgi:5-methylcytosine-specific restriction endonuclease McrA